MFCPEQETYGYVEKGYANIFVTNSLGFHDIERSKEKKAESLRIHIYGDSLTAAAGVPINKTIPYLIETYINQNHPETTTEVFNMASAEDSTCAEFLTYQLIGKDFSPDVVILYFMNDFHDNIFETHQRTRSPYYKTGSDGNLVFIPPIPVDVSNPWEQFKRRSLLYRLMANKFLGSKLYHDLEQHKEALLSYIKANNDKKNNHISPTETRHKFLRDKAWPITLRLLQEFKLEVEKTGAEFILVDGYPITPKTSGGYTNKIFEKFCSDNSISYIPMYIEYLEMRDGPNKTKYFLQDSHPTSLGNEKLSEFLTKKLEDTAPSLINLK